MGDRTPPVANRVDALVQTVLFLGSAAGLLKRKKLGFYLTYAIIVLKIVGGLFQTFAGEAESSSRGLVTIVIGVSWGTYFWKRRRIFIQWI